MEFISLYVNKCAMETKLTLRLNKRTIDKAKNYAQNHNISISRIVETYLESITRQKAEEMEISLLVESLSGVIKLDGNFDFRKDYSNYLAEKYK
jgi:pyruvate formate-lyase activating enzyme-like uncharacterized protein